MCLALSFGKFDARFGVSINVDVVSVRAPGWLQISSALRKN